MSQNEHAVCLPLGQEVWCDVTRRNVSDGDAVDLRAEEEPIDAVGADDGLNGGQLVTMLCGDGVEVIGHPMSALESGENGQTADHGELPVGTASVNAARDVTGAANPELAKRSSPDTDGLLRVPAFEYLAPAGPVLGKVEGDDQAAGHKEAVSTLRGGQGEPVS